MFSAQNQNIYLCYGKVAVATSQSSLKWDDFWIQVRGFWLEISKKVGQPCYFIIPLDLVSLTAGFQETNVQNSITLLTSQRTGSIKIYLQSTNRFDIIQLFHAIQNGQNFLRDALGRSQLTRTADFECETSSFLFFGKAKLRLSASQRGFEFTGNKNSTFYELDKISAVFAKVSDNNADTKLCISVDENGSLVTKEFNCLAKQNLVNAISCYMINSFAWEQAARHAAPGAPIQDAQ